MGREGKWREEGGKKENRLQLKRHSWEILRKISPTCKKESYYCRGNQHRAKRILSAEHLCFNEKLDQQKASLMRARRREWSWKKVHLLLPQVQMLLTNNFNEEKCLKKILQMELYLTENNFDVDNMIFMGKPWHSTNIQSALPPWCSDRMSLCMSVVFPHLIA